jgi:AcrR family transcriptional regulator
MADVPSAYDEKLESILRCAAIVFAEKGYHQASIRDIARTTGVSLSGLYYYFQSKEELLFLIQDHALGTLLADLDRLLAGITDPQRKLKVLMENHLRYFLGNRAEMKVLAHEAESLSGEYQRTVLDQKRRLTEIASRILRELNPESPFDPRIAVFSLFGMMNWIYTWYRPEHDAPVERLADEMSRLFLSGYASPVAPLPPVPRPELHSTQSRSAAR